MPIKELLFPSQQKDEKVYLMLRRHWFTYLYFLIIGVLALLPVIIFAIYWAGNPELLDFSTGNIVIVVMGVYVLSLLALLLYGFVGFYLDVDIVTDRRIVNIEQKGFFKRGISELHLRQVQDATAQVHGMFETVFHFGDVLVQTAGERPNFTFKKIPHPYRVSKKIIDLHEAQIQNGIDKTSEIIEHDLEKGLKGGKVTEKMEKDVELLARTIVHGVEPRTELRPKGDGYNSEKKSNDGGGHFLEEGEMREGKEIDFK